MLLYAHKIILSNSNNIIKTVKSFISRRLTSDGTEMLVGSMHGKRVDPCRDYLNYVQLLNVNFVLFILLFTKFTLNI